MNTSRQVRVDSPRILVVVASYGRKNLEFLNRVIQSYRAMDFAVTLVVVSESPKHLPDGVENVVGLPAPNPWTLPFAHKPVFAERVDQYDLFIYSEDDIGVTEGNIRAFLSATPALEPDEIAGFLRYEVDRSGTKFLAEPWGHYHWKPDSVRLRGTYTVAEFSNEHAGFYILTRDQLKRAIASGGFLRPPYRGRYSWPETAATDPYTSCGFRKVICISQLDAFLVHHLPNPYVHQLDVSLEAFREQIRTLDAIRDGTHPASTLGDVESKLWPHFWQKAYYEKPAEELLELVPADARNILSIGCGWGAAEARWLDRGHTVTAVPLDSVIGAVAERKGIEVVYGTWQDCLRKLAGRKFDCVVMTNLLHLQPDPAAVLRQCSQFVGEFGSLILGGPNFNRLPWLIKRTVGLDDFGKLRRFATSGLSLCSPASLKATLRAEGFPVTQVKWLNHSVDRSWAGRRRIRLGVLSAKDWLLRACRAGQRAPKSVAPSQDHVGLAEGTTR